jgi:hypothetical protein
MPIQTHARRIEPLLIVLAVCPDDVGTPSLSTLAAADMEREVRLSRRPQPVPQNQTAGPHDRRQSAWGLFLAHAAVTRAHRASDGVRWDDDACLAYMLVAAPLPAARQVCQECLCGDHGSSSSSIGAERLSDSRPRNPKASSQGSPSRHLPGVEEPAPLGGPRRHPFR